MIGAPLAGVSLAATGGANCTTSDAAGHYSCTAPSGWSGSVTPSLSSYSFAPSARNYANLLASQSGHDYAAGTGPQLQNGVQAALGLAASDPVKLPRVDGLAFDRFGNMFGLLEVVDSGGGVVYIDKATSAVTPIALNIPGACQFDIHPNGDLYVSSELPIQNISGARPFSSAGFIAS